MTTLVTINYNDNHEKDDNVAYNKNNNSSNYNDNHDNHDKDDNFTDNNNNNSSNYKDKCEMTTMTRITISQTTITITAQTTMTNVK